MVQRWSLSGLLVASALVALSGCAEHVPVTVASVSRQHAGPSPTARSDPPGKRADVIAPHDQKLDSDESSDGDTRVDRGSGIPTPAAPFPTQVAGFSFGQTPAEFARVCRNGAGQARPTDDPQTFECTHAPVDAFQAVHAVLGTFCGNKMSLCRVMLVFRERSRALADRVRRQLEEKYGPMDEHRSNAPCSVAPVGGELNGVWTWAKPLANDLYRVTGFIRFIYGCPLGQRHVQAFMFYEDENGYMQSIEQDDVRNRNF